MRLEDIKANPWFYALERFGFPIVVVAALAIGVDAYWLRPARTERVQDREQLSKEREEDRALQKVLINNQSAQNSKLQNSLDRFALSIDKLSSVIEITNQLVRASQTSLESKILEILDNIKVNRERIENVDKMLRDAALRVNAVDKLLEERTNLITSIQSDLKEIKQLLLEQHTHPPTDAKQNP